jgi:outer membrane protein OmpA-like peptidoglycan-associated protein
MPSARSRLTLVDRDLVGPEVAAQPRPDAAEPQSGVEDLRQATVLRLQQGYGNAWVARQVANRLMRQGDPAREAFVNRGVMPAAAGLDFQSSTGIGGFNVSYDPRTQSLSIRLRVGVVFNNALNVVPATGVVTPVTPDFAADAASVTANFAAIPARVAEVQTNWQWSVDQQDDWRSRYEATVEGAWGGQHYFVSNRWDDLFANVNVDVDVHNGHRANDHCKATVFKVPEGSRSGPGAVVNTPGGATSATGTFTSAGLGAPFDFLNYSLQFPKDSADLRTAVSTSREASGDRGDQHLDKLIVDFQRGTPTGGAHVTVTGHASATGDSAHNQRLSQRRADGVANYLRTHGQRIATSRITVEAVGDTGATADPSFQRVDISFGSGDPQITMAHETGHMFGLDDEYASPAGGIAPGAGTPGVIGAPVAHSGLAAAMGGGVGAAVSENNDNIMSVGNVVRPQHYSTFLEALNQVATPEAFHYGGAGHSPDVVPDLIGPDVPAQPGEPTAVA